MIGHERRHLVYVPVDDDPAVVLGVVLGDFTRGQQRHGALWEYQVRLGK